MSKAVLGPESSKLCLHFQASYALLTLKKPKASKPKGLVKSREATGESTTA